jgi:type IV secretory pathway TrbF-like protein
MNRLFKKQLVTAADGNGQTEKTPNPYLAARRAWNSQIDRAFSSLHAWQLVGVASLLIALASVAGVIYIGSQAKFVPYVIEIDKLGDAVAVGPAQSAGQADPRVVRASLASFIAHARQVTPDLDIQRQSVFGVYAHLKTKDPATQKMNEFLGDDSPTSPFKRAATLTVATEISTVLPISATSWQVDWQEITHDRDGGLIGKPVSMRAVLEIYIEPLIDARQSDIQRNPLGIFVRDYNWQAR